MVLQRAPGEIGFEQAVLRAGLIVIDWAPVKIVLVIRRPGAAQLIRFVQVVPDPVDPGVEE